MGMAFTPRYRVMNAVRFFEQQQFLTWLLLGQADPWTTPYSDLAPPPTPLDVIEMVNPICAIPALVLLVFEDPLFGIYQFKDSLGDVKLFSAYATVQDAINNDCTQVMIRADALGDDLVAIGVNSFRTMGFTTDLVTTIGNESDIFLPPANIVSYGNLETLNYSMPIPTVPAKTYTLSNILEY